LIMQDMSYHLFVHINHLSHYWKAQTEELHWFSTSSRPSMNLPCHSKTRAHDITWSPYASFNSCKHSIRVFFFSFTRNIRLMRCSIFIPVTNPAEQHNTVTLKQSSEVKELT
jgi:hypothetical protein